MNLGKLWKRFKLEVEIGYARAVIHDYYMWGAVSQEDYCKMIEQVDKEYVEKLKKIEM